MEVNPESEKRLVVDTTHPLAEIHHALHSAGWEPKHLSHYGFWIWTLAGCDVRFHTGDSGRSRFLCVEVDNNGWDRYVRGFNSVTSLRRRLRELARSSHA
jgi:hypothetical protein